MTTSAPIERSTPGDRMLAMVGYGLLAAAPFTLGALAILAVANAYLRRRHADPIAASHYAWQIRSFWMDLIMVGLGFMFASGALAAGLGAVIEAAGVPVPFHYDAVHVGVGAIILAVLWGLCWLIGIGGLILGSIRGAMRLASGRPAGKTPIS